MRTKQVKIADFKLADYNPRQITDHDMASLVNSIREFGFLEPVVVNKNNTVIGGHQRLIACQQLSIETVPVVYVDLPKKKEKTLNLVLNRAHGDWDIGKLSIVLEELKLGNGDDLELTGFEMGEVDQIVDSQFEGAEDSFDAVPETGGITNPESKRGEIYRLGRHRLMCGDATCWEDVDALMDGKRADMVFTDPPYNVAYEGDKFEKIAGDEQTEEQFVGFSELFIGNMSKVVKAGGTFYICSGYSSFPTFLYALRCNGFKFSLPIIWVKNNTSMGWGDYHLKHEMVIKTKKPRKRKKGQPILYGWKGGRHYFQEARFEADVWEIKRRPSNTMVHPTQKPLALILRAIRNSSKVGGSLLDLFGGSGATLIAAEKTGRVCYMMEIDPVYCDVIQKRYEEYVGENKRKSA